MFATKRLVLRKWLESDVNAFVAMNSDPQVMEYFPATLTREETLAMVSRIQNHFDRNGFGLWAVELPERDPFIGFVGLQIPRFAAPFMPCVEVGWRLTPSCWGQGYATEAALKALQIGFEEYGLEEIVSMTAVVNRRSRRVMEKIGMSYSASDDFLHPKVPAGSVVQPHVLYRITAHQFRANLKGSS